MKFYSKAKTLDKIKIKEAIIPKLLIFKVHEFENNKSKIQILIDGIALNSAMKGDYVEVLNKSTGKPIKAWVKNNKKVSIFR